MKTYYCMYFGHAWPQTSKMIVSIWRNLWRSSTSVYPWLCTPKVILSYCRKPMCLSQGKKINFIPHAFLKILLAYTNFLFWVLFAYMVTHIQKIQKYCFWGLLGPFLHRFGKKWIFLEKNSFVSFKTFQLCTIVPKIK